PAALCHPHERPAVPDRGNRTGSAFHRLGLGTVPRQPQACGDQDLQVFALVPAVAVCCPAGGSLRGSSRMALSGVQKTVIATVAVIALVVGATVNKVLRPAPLIEAQLTEAGFYIIDSPRPVSDVRLTTEKGGGWGRADLEGQWNLLFIGYTNCPDICPTTMAELRQLSRNLPEQ